MAIGTYTIHRRALAALNELTPAEQETVREQLTALDDFPVSAWPAATARRLPGDPSLYRVPVTDGLQMIVRAVEGQPREVLDITSVPAPVADCG